MYTRAPTQLSGGDLGPPTLLGWDYANESPFKSSRPRVPSPGSARTRGGNEDFVTMRVQGVLAVLGTLLVLGAAQRRKWGLGGTRLRGMQGGRGLRGSLVGVDTP